MLWVSANSGEIVRFETFAVGSFLHCTVLVELPLPDTRLSHSSETRAKCACSFENGIGFAHSPKLHANNHKTTRSAKILPTLNNMNSGAPNPSRPPCRKLMVKYILFCTGPHYKLSCASLLTPAVFPSLSPPRSGIFSGMIVFGHEITNLEAQLLTPNSRREPSLGS